VSELLTAKIRRNLGWKAVGLLIEKSLRFVLVALISRALGPKMYGQYTYAIALALLLVQMTDMGLGLFLAREVAKSDAPPARLIGHVFTLKLVLAAGYLLVIGGLAWWHLADPVLKESAVFHPRPGALGFTVALAGLASLAVTTIEAIWQVFRGVQRMELEARSSSVFAVAQLVSLVLLLSLLPTMPAITADKGLLMVAIASSQLVAGLVGLGYTGLLLFRVVQPEFGLNRPMLTRFTREVLPLGVAIVASLIYFKIDVPLLRTLRGDEEVGLYNAAYKLLENLSVIPSVLLAATFPALSQTVDQDPHAAVKLHRTTLYALMGAGGVAVLVLWAAPKLLIGLLNGPEYLGAVPILQALAPSVLLTFVNYLETHMLIALGLVKSQMAFALALIAVNVAANLTFIPIWGGAGSALATLLTELVLLGFCMPLVHRTLKARVAQADAQALVQDSTAVPA
jgi:O-antigen/teichoic acid export membrane protein